MVLIVQDYDTSSSTISQVRTMEVRSSKLRSWRQVSNTSKKYKAKKQNYYFYMLLASHSFCMLTPK